MESLYNDIVAMQEKMAEIIRSHPENQMMKELSRQLDVAKQINVDQKQKIENQTLLVNKTEIAFNAKEELVVAKNEIIINLKIIIENLKETCNCKQEGGEVMTPNDNNQMGDNREEVGLKQGVKECCEFVEVHATKGVIMNGFLLWANIQRQTTPDNIWKDECTANFLKEEITDAKEML